MILTCPRCATRYLADETRVWATGRTVQCGGCGQRWRAFGGGVDPRGLAPDEPRESPPLRAETPAPSATAAPGAETPTAAIMEDPEEELEAGPMPGFKPLEPIVTRPPAAAAEPLSAPALFRTPPRRAARTSRYGPPGLGAALAILFLIFLAGAVAVVYRDVIARAIPALAGVYRAIGLPPTPPEVIAPAAASHA